MSLDIVTPEQFRALYPVFELLESDPVFRADPHARWREVASRCPVSRDDAMRLLLVVDHASARETLDSTTKYVDVRAKAAPGHPMVALMLPDDEQIAQRLGSRSTVSADTGNRSMLRLDNPDHARVRRLFRRHLRPRMMAARPRIEASVDTALARLDGRGQFDVIADFAVDIPILVMSAVLGITNDDFARFMAWSHRLATATEPMGSSERKGVMIDAMTERIRYASQLIEQCRARPGEDFISALIQEQAEGYPITDLEIVDNLVLLFIAGHLTTCDLIGSAVWLLLSHPEQRAKLDKDPSLIALAIEEALRFEPPVTRVARVVTDNGEVSGCPYQAGDIIGVSIQAANRDTRVFENADHFDITREANRHVSFGGGAHLCLGALLGRLEGQIAVSRLFGRFPHLRLADPSAAPKWRATPSFRGIEALVVRAA